jgi:hypothetical protein
MQMEKSINKTESDGLTNHFLTGAILFANLDYSGLSDYAVKAVLGGAIWMAFKLAGDVISYKLLNRFRSKRGEEKERETGK